MRKLVSCCFLTLVLITTRPAHATDCSAETGSGWGFEDYSAEKLNEGNTSWDCWSLSGVSATTMANYYSEPGFEMRYLSSSAVRSYTLPSNRGAGHFEVEMRVEFSDPNTSWYNQINAYVSVYHPGTSSYTNYPLYYRDGTMGNDTGSTPTADLYGVAVGDTITIYINGAWSFDSDSHARFTDVHLYHIDA